MSHDRFDVSQAKQAEREEDQAGERVAEKRDLAQNREFLQGVTARDRDSRRPSGKARTGSWQAGQVHFSTFEIETRQKQRS